MARAVTSDGDRIDGLGVGGHLVLAVVREGDLDAFGLRLDLVDLADRHAEDAHLVADEDAVAVGEVGDHRRPVRPVPPGRSHDDPGDQRQRPAPWPDPILAIRGSSLSTPGCGRRGTGRGRGRSAPVWSPGTCRAPAVHRVPERRASTRSSAPAAVRRRPPVAARQRFPVGVAAGGPGSGTPEGPHP